MRIKKFDFLDFGASKGASLEFGKDRLFGKRGLGIDLDPKRVKVMNDSGYDCMVGDLTDLKLPAKCVRFVKMAHILEHLPSLADVEKVVATGKRCATHFMVITGPFFDEDDYLRSKGLKLEWADYPEHSCHLKVSELVTILDKLDLDYELYLRLPMTDSSNEHIHPLNSPSGSHKYDPDKHPAKKRVVFDRNVWTDFVCYVKLKETERWPEITKAYLNPIPYIERRDGKKYAWPERSVKKFIEMDAEIQVKGGIISDLKAQRKQLSEEVSNLKKQLMAIKASKTWKAAGVMKKILKP